MATDGSHRRRRIYVDGQPSINSASRVQIPSIPPASAGYSQAPTRVPRMTDPDGDTAARLETDLRNRLADLRRRARRISASIARHADDEGRRHDAEVAARQREVIDRRDAELALVDGSFADRQRLLEAEAARAAHAVAPGVASCDWPSDTGGAPARPATHVRYGTTGAGVPAVAPFLEHAGWALHGDEYACVDLIRQVVLRTTAQIPLRYVNIRVFDPRIEGALGWLSKLREANPASYPPPAHSTDDLREMLAAVTASASAAAESINSRHVRTLGDLWLDEGRPTHPYTLLVVFGYPLGVDEATQAALIRLAESGAPRGVSLLVHVDEAVKPARDVRRKDLLRHLTPFEAVDGQWRTPLLPIDVAVAADPPPSREVVTELVSQAVREVSADSGPTIPLAQLLAPFVKDPWRDSVDDGIEAVIGLRGRDPVTLALRSENPPHPNLLIGGAVGQGKSNLLLTIIYALASRYGPDELEMLLLDFKQGLEFKRFDKDADGRNWLPHARVLSLESSKPFGLAVLEFVHDEMERRAALFKDARCNGFREYRLTSGQTMTRLLLIVDEFQVLFDGNDDLTAAAVQLFERLARQGRAYGIHILLSSQTLSGISGFQVKGDSIFAQFPLRVSLKNTADESQAILSRGNTAAATLTYRGEIVVNRDYGMAAANEIGIAGYADPDWISRLQQKLWEGTPSPREPWVFLGNDFAQWPNSLPACPVPTARIGRPIAVTDELVEIPFADDVDQAVALIGSGDQEAAAVLTAAVTTLTAGWGSGARVVLLDGLPADDLPDRLLGRALDRVRSHGVQVDVLRGDDVPGYLMGQLAPLVRQPGPPVLVLAIHLQRIAAMTDEHPLDPDNEYGPTISGVAVLRDLAMQGGTAGVHLIGWWPNLRALSAHLGYDHGGVSRYVFLKAGLEDLRQVTGPHAQPPEGSPRVQLFDRGSDRGATVVVPFDPEVPA